MDQQTMDANVGADVPAVTPNEIGANVDQLGILNQSVDEMAVRVDQIEQKLKAVEQFYSNSNVKQPNTQKGASALKDKEKALANFKKRQQDAARREAAAAKRMQELIRQFGTIIRQITTHKWAGPFLQPVDVVGLGLHDYYEVIEKPMDFSTIKSKMEATDGTGYKHVREICADVRLIFKNAMKYNEERDDVHVMAKTLLDRFETKWLQLLPKVDDEEKKLKEEEAEVQLDMQIAQEAAHAKMTKDINSELDNVESNLEDLKESVLQKCRKMTTEENKLLGNAITKLSANDINKALEIISQANPTFKPVGDTVEVDIDAQSKSTLWKLKFFVKEKLQEQMKNCQSTGGNANGPRDSIPNANTKRKREICDALAKTSQKRNKKQQ